MTPAHDPVIGNSRRVWGGLPARDGRRGGDAL